jgi:hypothetical protein
MVGLAYSEQLVWVVTAILQAFLLGLLITRKTVAIHPAFSTYIFLTLAQSGVLFLTFREWGYSSSAAWRIGWISQAMVLMARGFAVAELCRQILGRFTGVWLMARSVIYIAALSALSYALIVGYRDWALMLTTGELGIEFAIAVVIVLLVLFARYYEIMVDQPLRSLCAGLCMYSCISVLNDTILERFLSRYVSVWNSVSMIAFLACLAAWTWAFRRTVPQASPSALLLDRSVYLRVIPDMNLRLRRLNEQLMHIGRLEAPPT